MRLWGVCWTCLCTYLEGTGHVDVLPHESTGNKFLTAERNSIGKHQSLDRSP